MEPMTVQTGTAVNGYNQYAGENTLLRQKLEELTKDTNHFTYIVTHDLQAPLRMVTGFLDLLSKKYADKLDAGAKQYIEYAVKGSLKMKELVFDLLEYSRLNTTEHEYGIVNMNDVLSEALEKLKPEIAVAGAVVTVDELPELHGCKKMLLQCMVHLVDNALKFRKKDVPSVVHIFSEQQEGFVGITVSDNGMGIETQFFDKIFVIFRRLHTDEAGYIGTGTGLAVCKKIAELHEGRIEVSSEIEKGSRFTLFIPVK